MELNKFIRYKPLLPDVFVLLCLLGAALGWGNSLLLGMATGATLVRLGKTIGEIKEARQISKK